MQRKLSICALFFGDHTGLTDRCLSSIAKALKTSNGCVQDFRLACNAATDSTRRVVRDFTQQAWEEHAIPSRIFVTDNVYKYPMMRKMFYNHEPLAPATMWFDDDSYFEPVISEKWWTAMWGNLEGADMIGQHWLMPIQGKQWDWIQSQPWFNPKVGRPPKKHKGQDCFEFCQGAWWVIWSSILQRYDWPVAEIRHNGGDSMLGELCRHQELKLGRFHGGVRINADAKGQHSKSKRRGQSENRVGWNYEGQPLDINHQMFGYASDFIGDSWETAGSPQNSPKIINLFGTGDGN